MRGLFGSIDRSTAPALSLSYRTRSQSPPPLRERYTPRWPPGPNRWPKAATYTRSGSAGWTRILPMWRLSSSPAWLQLRPPSELRYTPSPQEMSRRVAVSPMPA